MADRTEPENALARKLLATTEGELRWLTEDGYTEERRRIRGAGFTLQFLGASRIWVTVDLSRSNMEVFVGGGRREGARPRTSINRILRARGETPTATLLPNRASEAQTVATLNAHLAGLQALRGDILQGDWSSYQSAGRDAATAEARHRKRAGRSPATRRGAEETQRGAGLRSTPCAPAGGALCPARGGPGRAGGSTTGRFRASAQGRGTVPATSHMSNAERTRRRSDPASPGVSDPG